MIGDFFLPIFSVDSIAKKIDRSLIHQINVYRYNVDLVRYYSSPHTMGVGEDPRLVND